jgi:hypothetical protein
LGTPPASRHEALDGIFFRVQDFSQSYAQLTTQFVEEYSTAWSVFPTSKSVDELHSAVSSRLRPYSTGKNHFTTYDLSPLLRHYVNDSCRLLEPTTSLLKAKFPDIPSHNNESLGAFLQKVVDANTSLNFNAQLIIELYEVWNDYKHRSTKGLHATGWSYETNIIKKPELALPALNVNISELKNIEVDEFFKKLNKVFLDYLNFVI